MSRSPRIPRHHQSSNPLHLPPSSPRVNIECISVVYDSTESILASCTVQPNYVSRFSGWLSLTSWILGLTFNVWQLCMTQLRQFWFPAQSNSLTRRNSANDWAWILGDRCQRFHLSCDILFDVVDFTSFLFHVSIFLHILHHVICPNPNPISVSFCPLTRSASLTLPLL